MFLELFDMVNLLVVVQASTVAVKVSTVAVKVSTVAVKVSTAVVKGLEKMF
jgi:hypothetical protein